MLSNAFFLDNNQLTSKVIPNINDIKLTSEMVIAYSKQKNQQQQVNIVKDFLFVDIWRKEIVKQFKFQEINVTGFISYNRYEERDGDYLAIIDKIMKDVNSTQKNNVATLKIEYNQNYFQMTDTAVENINNATLVFCFRRKQDFLNNYFHSENNALINKISTANILPIAIDGNAQDCISPSLQTLNPLAYSIKDYGLAYSTFFAELLERMGILNEASKSFLNAASQQLRKQIDIVLKDDDILVLIREEQKKIEEEVCGMLGL